MCLREMKEELPMLTSTVPDEEFLPIVTFLVRIKCSKSRVSRRAMGCFRIMSDVQLALRGDAGEDLRAKRAKASFSTLLIVPTEDRDI